MVKQLLVSTALAAFMVAPATPPAPTAQDQTATPPAATAEQQVTPPPADAIIPAEKMTDMRADKLIGTTVYNADGQKVGSVNDIVFDKDGKIVGVVLKVGGLLGIGGKSVGIKWEEVQVAPQEGTIKVNYTEDQLKVAPDFKTKDAVAAEQQQQPMAPSSPTSTQ